MTAMLTIAARRSLPRTAALARVFAQVDQAAANDLLFLESWEMRPGSSLGAAFRAQQLRRANPALAAEIRDELAYGRAPERVAAE